MFRKGFEGLLTYAVKCNPSPHIIKQLHREGIKAYDVASNREMELIREHAPAFQEDVLGVGRRERDRDQLHLRLLGRA